MVDYNFTLPQQQYVQAPDLLKNYLQMQQAQTNALQMQQAQRTQQQQNALAELMKSGVDMNSPEFRQKALAIGGAAAMPYVTAAATLAKEDVARRAEEARAGRYGEQAKTAQLERQLKVAEHFRDQLPGVLASADPAAAWSKWQSAAKAALGDTFSAPDVFPGKEAAEAFMMKASDAIKAGQDKLQVIAGPGGIPLFANTKTGTFQAGTEAPPAGAGVVAPGNAYANRTAAIEGTGKNANSSAVGKFQFIDGTFVDTARKVFPELANKSPSEILALRGTKLPNGTQIEDVLEQRLRADNVDALTKAGIQPTAGNTYLAHFLGSGGATKLLTADPNTPVAQILSPEAIAANESILAGRTAGQIAAWANGKYSGANAGAPMMTMGQSFRPEGSVAGGLNALALAQPGMAPVVGNALAQAAQPAAQTQLTAPAINAMSPFQQAQQAANEKALQQKVAETTATEQAKASVKRGEDIAVDYAAARSTIATMDDVLKAVDELRKVPDKDKDAILGPLDARMPVVRRPSITAQAKLDNLAGQVTAMGKAAASLSGSLGNMAVQEWKIVADQIASLDPTRLDAKELNKQLTIIESKAKAAAARTRDVYKRQYTKELEQSGDRFTLPEDSSSAADASVVDDLVKKYGR